MNLELEQPAIPPVDLEELKKRITKLISNESSKERAKNNRRLRRLDFKSKSNREQSAGAGEDYSGTSSAYTDPQDRMIPYRLINSTIAREKPTYQQYMTSPTRVALFNDLIDPGKNCVAMENFFTQVFRYPGAIQQFMKCVDSAQLHGLGFIEIRYDITKPGTFAFVTHAYDDVLYPRISSLNDAYAVGIREYYTYTKIKKLKGIDETKKDRLLKLLENEDKLLPITKIFFNHDDGYYVVHWDDTSKDFLDSPQKFDNGFPGSELELPIFNLIYDQDDEKLLDEKRGRAYYDEAAQRAATVMISSVTEKWFKSSAVYGSLDEQGKLGSEAKTLELKIEPDTIINKPVVFFSTPEPSNAAFGAINSIETTHTSQIGQINFAANNRQDSRKTATELNAAASLSSMLSAVPISVFSDFLTLVINYSFKILVASVALDQDIPTPNTLTVEDFKRPYKIVPAGDADFVRRQEKLMQMIQMLPMVAGSAIGEMFIKRVIEYAFPDENFVSKLAEQDKTKEALFALSAMVKQFLASPAATAGIPPEQLQQAAAVVAGIEQEFLAGDGKNNMGSQPDNPGVLQQPNTPTGPTAA